MSKFSNLYDIDGNIINKSPQHTFTIEETEQLVDDLTKKVQENPDNKVYKVYLNNAQKWLTHLYDNMSREDLIKRMTFIADSIKNAKDGAAEIEQKNLEEINKIMDEFKKQYERDETVMDEYVQFDESPVSDETSKEPVKESEDGNVDA